MRAIALALLLLSVAARARAQGPSLSRELPWDRFEAAPVGTWVEYVLVQGDKAVGPYLRLTALGSAPGGGTWLEIWVSQRPGSATQAFRLRIEGGKVKGTWARLLGGKPQELPLEERGDDPLPMPVDGASLQAGEPAPIQTAAGTYRAVPAELRSGGGRIARSWISPEVPLLGLVRLERADGTSLELHGVGKDGRGVVEVEAASGGK